MKKKVIKKGEVFSSGEVMSMLENMNEGIQLIAEQHGGIVGRLDGIDGRLDSIDGRLDGIDGRLDGIDGRLDGIDGRLDKLQDDVTDIKYTLTTKADRSEVEKLEKRMVKVERAVFSKRS